MSPDKRIVVRPLEESEIPAMVKVWRSSGLSYRPKGRDSPARLRRQWRADPELFLGAFVNGKVAGVALLSHDGRKGWINRLAVMPEHQRKGIARSLIARSEQVFLKRGIRIFCVHIEAHSPASMVLFAESGYCREDLIHYYTKRVSKEY